MYYVNVLKIFQKNILLKFFSQKNNVKKIFANQIRVDNLTSQKNCFIFNFTIFFIKIYTFDLLQRQATNLHKFKRQQKIRY